MTDDGTAGTGHAWRVLVVTVLGLLLIQIPTSAVNVALPEISADLGAGARTADWFSLATMLGLTSCILGFSRLSDLLGRRRLFLAGVALAVVTSLASAVADQSALLILARALNGIAAAAVIATTTAQVTDAFPPRLLATGLSIQIMVASVATVMGPVIGGAVVSAAGWRWIFLINVPFGLASLACGWFILRAPRPGELIRERFDVAGGVLSAVALAALVLTVNGVSGGEVRASSLAWFVVAGVAGLGFVAVERRTTPPLVDLSLAADRARGLAYGAALCMQLTVAAVTVLVALHEQLVRHVSAAEAGLRVAPLALAMVVASPVAGALSRALAARVLSSVGAALAMTGTALFAFYSGTGAGVTVLVVSLALIGVGNGLFTAPNTASIMAGLPFHRRGVANGIRSVLFNTGQALGTAGGLVVVSAFLAQQGVSGYGSRVAVPEALSAGFSAAAVGATAVGALALGCSLGRGGPWRTLRAGLDGATAGHRSAQVPGGLDRTVEAAG
jgi:EmrB/QacA subfamily drug resistance transporter